MRGSDVRMRCAEFGSQKVGTTRAMSKAPMSLHQERTLALYNMLETTNYPLPALYDSVIHKPGQSYKWVLNPQAELPISAVSVQQKDLVMELARQEELLQQNRALAASYVSTFLTEDVINVVKLL